MKKLLLLSVVCALPLAAMDMDEAPVEISKEVQDLYAQLTKDVHPLYKAYYNGGIPEMEKVLAAGVDINAVVHIRDSYLALVKQPQTMVDVALDENNWDLAQWLRKHGAKPVHQIDEFSMKTRTKNNQSFAEHPTDVENMCLVQAAEQGKVGYVRWCVEIEKKNVNSKDTNFYGRTPLMYAAWKGHTDVVVYLLKAGANINARSNYVGCKGETALMLATLNDKVETVEALLNAGADLYARDEFGRTAFDYAAYAGHKQTLDLIKKHRAQQVNRLVKNMLIKSML